MTQEVREFLATTPVFRDLPPEALEQVARLFEIQQRVAGDVILRQGGPGDGVYFLRSGQLAVRVQRGAWRETVSYIQPPNIVGELSFVTGRPCVADVEVVVDAELLFLPSEAVPVGSPVREMVLRGMTRLIAERLQETVLRGARVPESPVVLLHNGPNWEAPLSFGAELAASIARQSGRATLLIQLRPGGDGQERAWNGTQVCDFPLAPGAEGLRAGIAAKMAGWKSRFTCLILNPTGPDAAAAASAIEDFANFHGELAGPGDAAGPEAEDRFLVQSETGANLPRLSGSRQLIRDAAAAEAAWRGGQPLPAAFVRTVDSMARRVTGTQVGIALGGGAAWGWAHIGVLEVIEGAGLPVDVIAGCSMGSVIGAFRAAGFSIREMIELALYWRKATKRFLEWRFWKMCLLNEGVVRKTFHGYFGDRSVNGTPLPYWANAVDIQNGREFTIQDGTLVDCIRASIALPGLLPPAVRDSHLLVDAGITDPVPASVVRAMGAHYAVAVNAMAALEAQKIERRYPFNAFDVMTRCMFVMGHEIGEARAQQAANVVFTPKLGDITMLQFDRSEEIIECGRQAAQLNLDRILSGYRSLCAREHRAPGNAGGTR